MSALRAIEFLQSAQQQLEQGFVVAAVEDVIGAVYAGGVGADDLVVAFRRGAAFRETTNTPAHTLSRSEILEKIAEVRDAG